MSFFLLYEFIAKKASFDFLEFIVAINNHGAWLPYSLSLL